MHPYASDSNERYLIPLYLAALAIISAFGLYVFLAVTKLQDTFWWIDFPSVAGFYLLYIKLFDKWIWKWRLLRAIGIVRIPNFNGTWVGEGESSYIENGKRKKYAVQMTIRQDWTKFRVWGETATSKWQSLIGSILVEGNHPSIGYEYHNVPAANAPATMHQHMGMARLELISANELDGDYYTGRDRETHGTFRLHRT